MRGNGLIRLWMWITGEPLWIKHWTSGLHNLWSWLVNIILYKNNFYCSNKHSVWWARKCMITQILLCVDPLQQYNSSGNPIIKGLIMHQYKFPRTRDLRIDVTLINTQFIQHKRSFRCTYFVDRIQWRDL